MYTAAEGLDLRKFYDKSDFQEVLNFAGKHTAKPSRNLIGSALPISKPHSSHFPPPPHSSKYGRRPTETPNPLRSLPKSPARYPPTLSPLPPPSESPHTNLTFPHSQTSKPPSPPAKNSNPKPPKTNPSPPNLRSSRPPPTSTSSSAPCC